MASFLGELKRRNVVKVAAAYAIVAWLVIQIAATVFPILQIPDWAIAFVTMLLLLGFPIAVVLSWAYELTPDGIARTTSVPATESITRTTGQKLNIVITGLAVLAVGFVAVSHYVLEGDAPSIAQDRRSIAVLPLTTQSVGEENAEFFAAGIHDQLLTQLARIGSLKVISRTSVMEYAETTKNMRDIGRELGVATILEGSVQQAGNMVLMNVQLIDAETDGHLWAQDYERELTVENIFAIQRETATAIAAALEAAILPEEAERLRDVPTQSRRALDFYLTGNEYLRNPDDRTYAPLAAERYQLAVQEDPNFDLAWAALARGHSRIYLYAVDRSDAQLERVRNAIDRAFAIAPGMAEAHLAFGDYYYHGFRDYDRAIEQYRLAEREGLSGSALLYESLAYVYRRMGRAQDAIENFERAIELDPRNLGLIFQQGMTHGWVQRYTEAERYFDRVLEIAPNDPQSYRLKAELPIYRDGDPGPLRAAAAGEQAIPRRSYVGWYAAMFEEDYTAAIGYLDAWTEEFFISQGSYIPLAALYGMAYRGAGDTELAAEQFALAREQLAPVLDDNPDDARARIAQAIILVGLEDIEAAQREARLAMQLMPRSVDALNGEYIHEQVILYVLAPIGDTAALMTELEDYFSYDATTWSIEGLARHPSLSPFADDARFQALVDRYGRAE